MEKAPDVAKVVHRVRDGPQSRALDLLFATKYQELDELLAKSQSLSDGLIYATSGVVQATFADDDLDLWNKAQKVPPDP